MKSNQAGKLAKKKADVANKAERDDNMLISY